MNKFKKFFTVLIASALLFGNAALPTGAVAPWNVTGNYELTFLLDGDLSATPYIHHATLTQTGSTVTGDGGYPATGGDTYHWNVTAGSQTADSLNLTVLYDLGAIGTTMNMVGSIAANGTVSGTWDDNFGGLRTGTWSITKGVSKPMIHTPANNAIVAQSALVEIDWTDSIGSNPPFQYMYEAFSDAGYTSIISLSGWLLASEIPTLGTPPGDYYVRVKAQNASLDESAWSNGASDPYKTTVTADPTPTPNPYAVPQECSGITGLGAPIVGTNGSDVLNGTSGNDLIFALGGSDMVNGKAGNDCIVGGDGSDAIHGQGGNDVILGGEGSDAIQGDEGNDWLYGQDGSDSVKGASGSDHLFGGDGSDSLKGDGGADNADGGNNSDACNAETETTCEA